MVADMPRQVSLRRFPGSFVLSYYVIIMFTCNIYNNNRVTSICIDLSKIKLFVLVFVFTLNWYGCDLVGSYFIRKINSFQL